MSESDGKKKVAAAAATTRVKKCLMKGCKETSLTCTIVNHSCPKHIVEMRERAKVARLKNYKKHNVLKHKYFNFCMPKDVKKATVLKELSWGNDIIRESSTGRGYLIGLGQNKWPYEVVKEYGVYLMPHAVEISDEEQSEFLKIVDSNKDKFKNFLLV